METLGFCPAVQDSFTSYGSHGTESAIGGHPPGRALCLHLINEKLWKILSARTLYKGFMDLNKLRDQCVFGLPVEELEPKQLCLNGA